MLFFVFVCFKVIRGENQQRTEPPQLVSVLEITPGVNPMSPHKTEAGNTFNSIVLFILNM